VINDKLQGSVATYLRCGGIVNDHIKRGLLLSPPVNKQVKSANIRQSYKQEGNHLLACNFAEYLTRALLTLSG